MKNINIEILKQTEVFQDMKTADIEAILSCMAANTKKYAKDSFVLNFGDTITSFEKPAAGPIEGFEEVKPMVFAGIYPIDSEDFEELRLINYMILSIDKSFGI